MSNNSSGGAALAAPEFIAAAPFGQFTLDYHQDKLSGGSKTT
jgi:hypothetical protein